MTKLNRVLTAALSLTTLFLACKADTNTPQPDGSLAVSFTVLGNATAPLDAMTVDIFSASAYQETVTLSLNGGFWEGTSSQLPPGTYSLTAFGRGGGEVTYYGRGSATVRSGEETEAPLQISEFVPTINTVSPPSPTKSMTFNVDYSSVPNATTYRVEWESGPTGGFVETNLTVAEVPVTLLGAIEFKVRAGNSDVDLDDAGESDPVFATTEADTSGNDQNSAAFWGAGAGTGVTIQDVNIGVPTEEDWYEFGIVGGEVLIASVTSASLSPMSRLDPYLRVEDQFGNLIAENDDNGMTVESAVSVTIQQSDLHYLIVSSSGGGSVGHYELDVQICSGQPVAAVQVSPASASIQVGGTAQLTATPEDANGDVVCSAVTWTSTNTGVATVDANGLVTGVAVGFATIVAESDGVTGKSDITVGTPTPATWTFTGSMTDRRRDHTATLLPNGDVLVLGGTFAANSAEIYDPASGQFAIASSQPIFLHTQGHTTTLLNDGRVLVVGGLNTLRDAEIYDPAIGTFTASLGTVNANRTAHSATLLKNGRVLLTGGQDRPPGGPTTHSSAEVYDPITDTFIPVGNLNDHRAGHTATLLDNGLVLIAGGVQTTSPGIGFQLQTAELYDPATQSFRTISNMLISRDSHTATLLDDGSVLLAGGIPAPSVGAPEELYDPATESFIATGTMTTALRNAAAATLLPSGRVLIAGGVNNPGGGPVSLNTAELFDPATGIFTALVNMNEGRQQHTMTLLPNGAVLVIGGFSFATGADFASAELYQ